MALGREMSTPPKLQYEYGTLYLYLKGFPFEFFNGGGAQQLECCP